MTKGKPNTHLDLMRQWWKNAKRKEINIGDQVIQYHHTAPNEYTIFEADEYSRDSGSFMRVLPDTL